MKERSRLKELQTSQEKQHPSSLKSETHAVAFDIFNDILQVETCSIKIIKGLQAGEQFQFSKDVIRVGAHPRCDIQINDGTVSRFHCEIHRNQDGYRLIDDSSTNGTYVGELRVRDIFLMPNLAFQIGNTTLNFSPQIEEINVEESKLSQLGPLIGASRQMRNTYTLIQRLAPSDLSVIVQGETGTGKELVAQAIHELSHRSKKTLVVFDCSAVPEHLIESELFGHEKGAFSGAVRTHAGLFEQADGGTLFLDELGELPINLQPKLLRALESGVIRRVGAEKTIRVDVRVISATNRDLAAMVKEGKFRQDLFYRLAKVIIHLPPLNTRKGDAILIAQHFLMKLNKQNEGRRFIKGITPNALHQLEAWEWPGNVRELRNIIERAYTFADREMIHSADLVDHLNTNQFDEMSLNEDVALNLDIPESCSLKEAKERIIESFERDYLQQLLSKHNNNISAVSRDAGIDRRHVYRLMKKYEMQTS
jgi:transcriptional regulator with GAF, ATPase, and Fis domain